MGTSLGWLSPFSSVVDVRGEDGGVYLPTGRGWEDRVISDALCHHQPSVAASSGDHTLHQPVERTSSQRSYGGSFRHQSTLTLWVWGTVVNKYPCSSITVVFSEIFRGKTDFHSCLFFLFTFVAKEPHCKHLRSLYTDLRTFRQGQLFDQSCRSWHKRRGICLTLPLPSQQQSSPERQFECSSQGCRPHFSDEQRNGRLRVRKFTLWMHLSVLLHSTLGWLTMFVRAKFSSPFICIPCNSCPHFFFTLLYSLSVGLMPGLWAQAAVHGRVNLPVWSCQSMPPLRWASMHFTCMR